MYGARHLFPAAPGPYALAARALSPPPERAGRWPGREHLRGAALLAVVAAGVAAQRIAWRDRCAQVRAVQRSRVDARAFIARHGITRGIIAVHDPLSAIAGMDPWS